MQLGRAKVTGSSLPLIRPPSKLGLVTNPVVKAAGRSKDAAPEMSTGSAVCPETREGRGEADPSALKGK